MEPIKIDPADSKSDAAEPITRLPSYFPTFPKECKEAANDLYACLDLHAVMKHEKDVESCKGVLSEAQCQQPLRKYMKCVEEHVEPKAAWWKVW